MKRNKRGRYSRNPKRKHVVRRYDRHAPLKYGLEIRWFRTDGRLPRQRIISSGTGWVAHYRTKEQAIEMLGRAIGVLTPDLVRKFLPPLRIPKLYATKKRVKRP